jgi:hypothetical protein
MSAHRPTLPEPIEVAKFLKTRWRSESVHVELSTYEGHNLISVRVYRTGADGIDRPTNKGLAMSISKLQELARALAKAEVKARELGLLPDDGAGE